MEILRSDTLPDIIPIFPLPGILLLPLATLPLNIFEPRYLAMTRDALKGDWLIGMIQPKYHNKDSEVPDLYPVGCAGKIASFVETDDGRILISLKGIARFKLLEETTLINGYRRARVHWDPFDTDIHTKDASKVDREQLEVLLRKYFEMRKVDASWAAIERAPDAQLVASLAMQCPFTLEEKQALLEAPALGDRANLIVSLLSMAITEDLNPDATLH